LLAFFIIYLRSPHIKCRFYHYQIENVLHGVLCRDRCLTAVLGKAIGDFYRLENIVATAPILTELKSFIEEHRKADLLRKYNLPIANKLLLDGPSGCGKTLASYVIARELDKMMVVVNLGAIVSSK